MEQFPQNIGQIKSVKEGGLEAGILKMREHIDSLTSMVDQIEKLQKVPHGYTNLGDQVGNHEISALDQFTEYREAYEVLQKNSEESLSLAYAAIMKQLSMLREHTGISSEEEAMKFDKDTGRQPKDI